MKPTIAAVAASAALLAAGATHAGDMEKLKGDTAALSLGTAAFTGGKSLDLSIGIGSGAFHVKGDPANLIWTISDRGPNIDCAEAEKITGLTTEQACMGDAKGKLFPRPEFTPSLYKVELGDDGSFKVLETIPLADASGKPITGISNPLKLAKTEKAYDIAGAELPLDAGGLDTEGLVRLADGSFWIADEYGPGLVHVAADGRIVERVVPAGIEADLAAAPYKVTGALPAILSRRALNRGIESVALAPDGASLYLIVQNPLANPDQDAYKTARMTRLLQFDPATGKVIGEYVYLLDTPDTFRQDKSDKQNDVRLSEMTVTPAGELVVLERISKTTKLHRVSFDGATNILGTAWDDTATAPSLEQLSEADLPGHGLAPVGKTLLFDSADHDGLPAKIEGVTFVDDRTMLLINDDDFGIDGTRTEIFRLPAPKDATN